ncbi:hypothetical protein ACFL6U_12535 [Planctomycetota bacterium]
MGRKLKVRKLGGVAVLTILIWVWADLALERQDGLSNVPVRIPNTTDPTLAAAFEVKDELSEIAIIDQIKLVGTERAINKMRSNRSGEDLKFRLVPEDLGLTKTGSHTIDLLDFLREAIPSVTVLEGLTAESCEPNALRVRVERLVKAPVKVQCVGLLDQIPIKDAGMDPPEVEMFIPESWPPGEQVAFVALTPEEVEKARVSPISRKPHVRILNKRHESETSVEVTMPPIEEQLVSGIIPAPNFGITINSILQNQYNVVLAPDQNLRALSPIQFRATEQAKQAYMSSTYDYHVILVVLDRDKDVDGPIPRSLKYNFPPEFPGQIRLDQDPFKVEFQLVPKSGNSGPPGTVD